MGDEPVSRRELDRELFAVRREFDTWRRDVYDRCYTELTEKVDKLTADSQDNARALNRIEMQGEIAAKRQTDIQEAATLAAVAAEKVRTNYWNRFGTLFTAAASATAVVLHFLKP